MRDALQVGDLVGGRFRLQQHLGEGGMGIVWEASNVRTHRTVALKVLKAESPEQRRRLFREGRIAGKLRHPNIVEVHDVIELDDGAPAIIMERLVGESLRTCLVREKSLPIDRLAEVFSAIARALACAHAEGVVHRDLKPENVFLTPGDVKVLDFGIARLTAADGDAAATSPLTETGDVLGTPSYMAPEQVFGERDVDTRADIWSFGVLLYEAISGCKPFVGDNFGQIFKQVAMGPITPLDKHVPEVPPELGAMVMRMLTRDREQRPTDWLAIIGVLERARGPQRRDARRRSRLAILGLTSAVLVVGSGVLARRFEARPPLVLPSDAAPRAEVATQPSSDAAAPPGSASAPSATPPRAPLPPRTASSTTSDPVLPGGVHGRSPY